MRLWVSIVIIFVIIMFSFFVYSYIDKTTDEFKNTLNMIENVIENEQWDRANIEFIKINQKWNKTRNTWSIILDHHEIDNIDLAISRVNKYISYRNTALSMGEIQVLKTLFSIVKESQGLSLSNVL